MFFLNLIYKNWLATFVIVVTIFSIILFDALSFDRFLKINYFNMVIELSVALISLRFFFIIQKYKNKPFYMKLNIGYYLFFLSYFVDGIDQIFIHSIFFTVVFEKLTLVSAIILIFLGSKQWMVNFEKISLTDELTQIPNRKLFRIIVQKEIQTCSLSKNTFCLAILDIDYFKRVNDDYGHLVGDKVLHSFAQLLSNKIGKLDVIGRWGGEEFTLLLRNTDIETAQITLGEIKTMIEKYSFVFNYKPINITCSIGVSQWQGEMDCFDSLFNKADNALFNAKNAGRNQIRTL